MRILLQIAAYFRALFHNREVDTDLADEMRFHIERETDANIASGMTPAAARRAARLSFGSVDAAQEQSREERPGTGTRQLLHDIRIGTRLLRKSPSFAVASVAIIALSIGAATAVFSVVYGVMLHPLPFREPERLVNISMLRGPNRARVSPSAADVVELRQLRSVYADVALLRNANLNLLGDNEPQRLQGARVSSNLFAVLGAAAGIGRTFTADEELAGREHVIVLSDALWRSRFAADSGIVGREIRIDGSQYTVVGVMPSDFQLPSTTYDAWVPNVVDPRELTREIADNYRVVARLAEGAPLELVRRETSALATRIAQMTGLANTSNVGMSVDPLLDDAVRDVRPALRLLLGAVAFLLCLASVNLANLFAARASARNGEFAVRLALGASRRRLISQAVAEAVPVLVIGGVLGIVAAKWAIRLFVATAPAGLPRIANVTLSAPVVAFSILLVAVTGIAVSLAPAVQAWRSDFTTITKDGGRASTTGRRRSVTRRIGVAAQIAFALPLLVGAGLLLRSAINLSRVDLGFRSEHVAALSFEVSRSKHVSDVEVADYYEQLVDAVRTVPGVTNVALTNRIPLFGGQSNSVHFENGTAPTDELTDVDSRTVTPDYFTTLGIKVVSGRTLTERDNADAPLVVVVDERIARTIFPGEEVIGKRFNGPGGWGEIIGVVAHVRTTGLEVDPRPQVYWSYRQWTQNRMVLAVQTRVDSRTIFPSVITAIRSVDPDQSVYEVRTLDEIVARSQAQRRLTTVLLVGFGGVALLLAAVGIYGVVAYGVTQRMREFGIRVALGASRRQVTGLVVWQGASMALAGSAVGLVLAIATARVMSSLVYGVAPTDLISILGATALVMLVAAIASYVPARRAAGVEPGITLRAE
jgi:putative ABC transport system permease protein